MREPDLPIPEAAYPVGELAPKVGVCLVGWWNSKEAGGGTGRSSEERRLRVTAGPVAAGFHRPFEDFGVYVKWEVMLWLLCERDGGGWGRRAGARTGERCLPSGFILKAEQVGFADRSDVSLSGERR